MKKETLEQAYYCRIHKNKKFISYCFCNNNICEDCSNNHFLHEGIDLRKKEINDNDIQNLQNKIRNNFENNFININSKIYILIKSFMDLKKNNYNDNFKLILTKEINNKFNKIKKILIKNYLIIN